jgi:hypothetical protein
VSFPLPIDPDFRKTCVEFWLDDVEDRLDSGNLQDAEFSWKEANAIYLSIPAGYGNMGLEDRIYDLRVKLDNFSQAINENNL